MTKCPSCGFVDHRSPPQVMEEEAAFKLAFNAIRERCPDKDICMTADECGCYGRGWSLIAALSVPPAEEGGSAAGAAPIASKRSTRSALSADLQDVLGEIEAFLQDQHDIRDGEGGQQLPNKAMALSIALKEALGERP